MEVEEGGGRGGEEGEEEGGGGERGGRCSWIWRCRWRWRVDNHGEIRAGSQKEPAREGRGVWDLRQYFLWKK